MKNYGFALLVGLCTSAVLGSARADSPGPQDNGGAEQNSAAPAEKSPIAQEKDACEKQEQRQGTSAPASAVKCVVKVVFQSRIRRRKDEEPVEMTAGSPPLQTEDTETPGAGNLEVNLVAQGESGGGEHRYALPLLDVNYGVGDTLQFSYSIPYAFVRQAGTDASGAEEFTSAHGIGDSSLGLKYRFYDNNETGISWAIEPQVEFRTPGAKRAVSEGSTAFVFPVVVTREYANASLTANAGIAASAGQQRYFGSFALGMRISDKVALLGEIAGNNLNASDEKRVLLDFGVRRKISGSQSISAALGRDIHAGGDQNKQVYFALAYQRIFGK
ncbi:MAG: transporter [Luteimonas sp.]